VPNSRKVRAFRRLALAVYPFCQWCGLALTPETATADHLLPRSRGGKDDFGNLRLACEDCNRERRDLPARVRPQGPDWGAAPRCAAWTRYPGGRWRSTLRGFDAAECETRTRRLYPTCEVVVLPAGVLPVDGRPQGG
jgi:hypothetical protein